MPRVTYENTDNSDADTAVKVEEPPVHIPDPEDVFIDTLSGEQLKVWSKLNFRPDLLDGFVNSLDETQTRAYQRVQLKRDMKALFTAPATADLSPAQESASGYYYQGGPKGIGKLVPDENNVPPGTVLYPPEGGIPKKTSKQSLVDREDTVTFIPEDPYRTSITVHGVRVDITPGEENTIPRMHYGVYMAATRERIATAKGQTLHARFGEPHIPVGKGVGGLRPLVFGGAADTEIEEG